MTVFGFSSRSPLDDFSASFPQQEQDPQRQSLHAQLLRHYTDEGLRVTRPGQGAYQPQGAQNNAIGSVWQASEGAHQVP